MPGNISCTASSSSYIWTNWNYSYTYNSTSSSTIPYIASDAIWTAWNYASMAVACTATNNTTIWTGWNDQLTQAEQHAVRNAYREPTAEQREEWRVRDAEARARSEARIREIKEAKEKAEVLLLRHLSPEQKEELRTKNFFTVDVEGMKYRISRGIHGNVHLLDSQERIQKTFCVQPKECPEGDAMLAQKLLLEACPEKLWTEANITEKNGQTIPRRSNILEFRKVHKRDQAAA